MNSTCQDVREHLYQNEGDVTTLAGTMAGNGPTVANVGDVDDHVDSYSFVILAAMPTDHLHSFIFLQLLSTQKLSIDSHFSHSVFGTVYLVIIVLGVLGNSCIVLSVLRYKSLQSVRNTFIVSLSSSDIVVCFVSGSFTPVTGFVKVWMFGAFLCRLVPLIQGISLCLSTFTLTSIAVDRFILIVFPMKQPIQMYQAKIIIILNVALATSLSLPMVFRQKLIEYGHFCGWFCVEDWGKEHVGRIAYGTALFCLQFGLPLVIIIFCYTMIFYRLSKGMLVQQPDTQCLSSSQANALDERRRTANRRRMRTNRMLTGMVAAFLLSWLPTVVFNFLRDIKWLPPMIAGQNYLFGLITHCISMTSTMWNPLLYAWFNEQFRLAIVSLFCCANEHHATITHRQTQWARLSSTLERKTRENRRRH